MNKEDRTIIEDFSKHIVHSVDHHVYILPVLCRAILELDDKIEKLDNSVFKVIHPDSVNLPPKIDIIDLPKPKREYKKKKK